MFFGVFWIFPKKSLLFFLGFQGFWFWKILKIQKKLVICFLDFFRLFLKIQKNIMFFFIFRLKSPKIQKTIVFLDCQEFPKAKSLKIKNNRVFWIFRLKQPKFQKKHCVFLDFSIKGGKNPKNK